MAKLREETNAERVRRLTNVAIKAGEGAEGQAAVRAEVIREREAGKRGGGIKVTQSGETVLVSDAKQTGFEVVARPEAVEAERQKQISNTERLNRGEVLTPSQILARGGSNIAAGSTAAIQAQQSVRNLQSQQVREQQAKEAARRFATDRGLASYEVQPTREVASYEIRDQPKVSRFQQKIDELRLKQVREGTTAQTFGGLVLYGAAERARQTGQALYDFAKFSETVSKNPRLAKIQAQEFGKSLFSSAATVVKNPSIIGEKIRQTDAASLGAVTFDVLAPAGAAKVVSVGRQTAIRLTKPQVPTTSVIDEAVLQGQRFPEPIVSPIADFQKARTTTGEFVVVSAGPAKYPTFEALSGSRAAQGLEDAGIFTTPKGRASANFLEIGREGYDFSVSLNPLSSFRKALQTPSVTEFTVQEVRQYPQRILRTEGFEEANIYAQQLKFRGSAFITKRSTTGITGRRPDTSELEAIIPTGSQFEYTNEFAGYTTYKGEVVAIRQARVIGGRSTTNKIKTSPVVLDLLENYKYLSSRKTKSVSLPVPRFSSMSSSKSSSVSKSLYKSLVSNYNGASLFSYKYSSLSKSASVSSGKNIIPSYYSNISKSPSRSSVLGSSGRFGTSYYGGSSRNSISLIKTPLIPRFKLPKEKRNNVNAIFRTPKSLKPRQFKFATSVAGNLFNIRGRKTRDVTGLGIRPI